MQIPAPTWCVAKFSATDTALQAFIDFCCGQLDCAAIKPGGMCYEPNNLRGHGSYALDLFYRTNKNCFPNIGMLVYKDPCKSLSLYVTN